MDRALISQNLTDWDLMNRDLAGWDLMSRDHITDQDP
jgi:hypothetical protein